MKHWVGGHAAREATMRARYALAILLLLPAGADAQRRGVWGRIPVLGRGGDREPPPQAPALARELYYRRLPYSIETYPMISRFDAPGYYGPAGGASWTSGGMGTRLDLRLARYLSGTLDVTTSLFGGPQFTQTIEVGTRVRSPRNDVRRLYPLLDLRGGYVIALHSSIYPVGTTTDNTFPLVPYEQRDSRYSQGIGGFAGGGLEVALTRTVSLTGIAGMMRTSMRTTDFRQTLGATRYNLMTYRYILGVRWNPVRYVGPPTCNVVSC